MLDGFAVVQWISEECAARGVSDHRTRERLFAAAADRIHILGVSPDLVKTEIAASLDAMGYPAPERSYAVVIEEDVPPPPEAPADLDADLDFLS
jgi:hypothetical protein